MDNTEYISIDEYKKLEKKYELLLKKHTKINNRFERVLKMSDNQERKMLDERLKLEYEVNKNISLYEKSKIVSMSEMIGNIAHQWRQPLSVISTAITGMQIQKEYDILKDEDFNDICLKIDNSAQYLSQTIDNFRNFIKSDIENSQFNLKNNINSFLKIIKELIGIDSIEIVLDLDDDIEIIGYENELIQCFINIFNNIKDITKQNISKKKTIMFITTTKENNKATISIKDNAGGISKDIIHKIFEPYFTTKHQSQGRGLSLYITYNSIVNSMNGTIDAKNVRFTHNNEKHTGAEFIITI